LFGAYVVGYIAGGTWAGAADIENSNKNVHPSLVNKSLSASLSEANDSPQRIVIPLADAAGVVRVWCLAVPFLRPADVSRVPAATAATAASAAAAAEDHATHTAAAHDPPHLQGVRAIYAQLVQRALAMRQPGQALVAMGHCHVLGGQVSEASERRITLGGAEAWPVDVFDPALAYVALGHLHLPQSIGKNSTRRYSGSPLPLSFSEVDYPHQVVLVTLDGEQVTQTEALSVPRAVPLWRVPAQPQSLPEVLQALADLPDIGHPDDVPEARPYLQVRVHLTQPEPSLRAHIDAALAHKAVRLVRIEASQHRSIATATPTAPALSLDDIDQLAPSVLFDRLYQHHFQTPPPTPLRHAFQELLNTGEE
jgi:exonuclease SbcD